MKTSVKKSLALLLCLLMVISAFAAIPMGAESTEEQSKDDKVLWSLDFDDYVAGTDAKTYFSSKGFYTNGFAGAIESNQITLTSCQWWLDGKAENDTFRDLFYGIYTDESGKKINNYYMEMDFTLESSGETKSYEFKGTDADGNTVTYTIYSPYRGDSYFNPLAAAGYDYYLFKISPTGHLYTYGGSSTQAFKTADGANTNIEYFTYSKKVGSKTTVTKQPVTQEAWAEMRTICGTEITSGSTFDRVHTGTNYYQIKFGTKYSIRIKMDVDAAGKVTATTYIKPANSDEIYTKVGAMTYTLPEANKGDYSKVIRISENHQKYHIDNIKFVNSGLCEGEHEFPTVVSKETDYNNLATCAKMQCLSCGAIYFTDCTTEKSLQSFDFSAMTQDEYNSFKSSGIIYSTSGSVSFSQGSGLSFVSTSTGTEQGGPDIALKFPEGNVNSSYRMSFTTTIGKLPTDQVNNGVTPGSSFITDRTGTTGSTNVFNILVRIGRYSDYDPSKTNNVGWLKLRTLSNTTTWKDIPVAYKLKEGETYTFDTILRPADNRFDLYINGDYVGTGYMPTDKWTNNATPMYRIGNQMQLNLVLKNYSVSKLTKVEDYSLLKGSDINLTLNQHTLKFGYDPTYGPLAKNVRAENSNSSTTLYLEDTDLTLKDTSFNVSFDFMMTDNGFFSNDISNDTALWSLISWVTSSTIDNTATDRFGTIVRVGALDYDETKEGFEKFFLVMDNNGAYTQKEDNGNQGYTTTVGGDIVGYYHDNNAVYTFDAGEWITISLSVNRLANRANLYVNGELVCVSNIDLLSAKNLPSDALIKSRLRIGDAYRKLFYNWAIKDIELVTNNDRPGEVDGSNTIFAVDFGRTYKGNSYIYETLGSTRPSAIKTTTREVFDSDTTEGYTRFIATPESCASGSSNLFNLSLTSKLADGSYLNHVDGKKYFIETTFALYDRAPTADELASVEKYNTTNGKDLAIPEVFSKKEATILRLSKYHDNNQAQLILHNASALRAVTSTGTVELYTKDANGNYVYASAWYKENQLVDGKIPDSAWLKVKAVIDSTNDTYSVYVNDSIAYYKSGSTFKRAENLRIKITTGANSYITKYPTAPESVAYLENPLYSNISRTTTVDGEVKTYNFQNLGNISYVRFFQNAYDFSVRDVTIATIENELDFIGTQIRQESETPLAFDLRFVFGTDNIYVDSIEYDVTASVNNGNEGSAETAICNTVYKSLIADNSVLNTWKLDQGEYFSVFTVNGIELSTKDTVYTFKVTPYTTALNSATGKIERDNEKVYATHVIEFNGLGEMISYNTENPEWASVRTINATIDQVPYKALGRTQMLNGALVADWSGAGIEFEATCLGNVSINLAPTSGSSKFTVVVDGVETKDVTFSGGSNIIAGNLPYGNHTFKIVNQSGYSTKVDIAGVTIRGTFGEKPADSDLLIEFLGDSITHGCGLGSSNYSNGTNDGTLTYAFIAAKELGADYTIMANGGMGVKWGGDYDSTNVNRSMAKYPYLNDTNRSGIAYDGYGDRKADIVVIGLSTNDNFRFQLQYNNEKAAYIASNPDYTADELAAHMDEFSKAKLAELGAELELLIKEIEKNHGKNVPIILARGMMERTLEKDYPNAKTPEEIAAAQAAIDLYHTSVTYMTDLIENKWNGMYGDHVLKVAHLTPDRTGYEGHPKREGAAIQGNELAEFIKTNFPELVPAK